MFSPTSPVFWQNLLYSLVLDDPVFSSLLTAITGLLTVAAGIYLAFIGWRAFKVACNKV